MRLAGTEARFRQETREHIHRNFQAIRMQCFSPNTTLPHERKLVSQVNAINVPERLSPDHKTLQEWHRDKKHKLDTHSLNSNLEGYSLMDQGSRQSPMALAAVFNKQRSKFQNGDLNLSKGTLGNTIDLNNSIEIGSLNVVPSNEIRVTNEGEEASKRGRVIFSKNGQIRYQKGCSPKRGREPSHPGSKNYERPTINSNVRYDRVNATLVKEEAEGEEASPESAAQ